MAIFLGIDGGGTKTSCLVGDEATILGRGQGGPSNVVRVGPEKARESLHASIREACQAARVSTRDIERTCLGLSGGARSGVSATARTILAELLSGEIQIVGDTVTTLEAAFGAGPGVIVIAGTGSVAYGRDSSGKVVRIGGWGYAVSDEGSAHWIGREAVSAALRAEDEGRKSAVLDAVQRGWSLASREELIVTANAQPDFAALLPAIMRLAEAGDTVAAGVLARAGKELARLAAIAIDKIFGAAAKVPVAMSGGVFRHSAAVREVFYNEVSASCPNAVIASRIVDPVDGALSMARTHHG